MSRIVLMIALIVAGEQVFGLPFHTQRFFKSTLLDVFGFTNTQFGDLFVPYGIAAMIAYFPGGALADRYSARSMLTISLIATGLGGLYMATIPSQLGMLVLYGYWGVTTIFLFWAALIKATRDWGGDTSQGMAFGILDGGRGLSQALFAALAVSVFATLMPVDVSGATAAERLESFRVVILLYTALTFLTAIFTWFAVPPDKKGAGIEFNPVQGMTRVLRRPVVWAISGVIICAYSGYKGLDNYQLYAVQVLGMNEVEGARLVTWGAYTRVGATILAGIVADRIGAARLLGFVFAIACIAFGVLSSLDAAGVGLGIIYLNFFVTFVAMYALRGVYFALLEEGSTPKYLTGAAVGMISLVGYTPDIFFGPIGGRILDANPGLVGFQNYFCFLAAIAAVGVLMVCVILRLYRKGPQLLWGSTPAEQK